MSAIRVLISAVVHGGKEYYKDLLGGGLKAQWITDPEMRGVWKKVKDYVDTFRQAPSQRWMEVNCGHFPLISAEDCLNEHPIALLAEVKNQFMKKRISDLAIKIMENPNLTATEAYDLFTKVGEDLRRSSGTIKITDVVETADEAIAQHNLLAAGGGDVIHWPWPSLQHETGGSEPGDMAFLFGLPKSMKSFVAFWIAVFNYVHYGTRTLVISRELKEDMVRRRIIAMMAEIHYGPWRRGLMTGEELHRVERAMRKFLEHQRGARDGTGPCIKIVYGNQNGVGGMDLAAAAIYQVEPRLVVDDSIYRAAREVEAGNNTGTMDWTTIMALLQGAKKLATDADLTYLATTQAKPDSSLRKGLYKKKKKEEETNILDLSNRTLGNMAFASVWEMECDLAMEVMYQKPDGKRPAYIGLAVPGIREGGTVSFCINAQPCIDFNEISPEEMSNLNIDSETLQAAFDRAKVMRDGPPVYDPVETSVDIQERELHNIMESHPLPRPALQSEPEESERRSVRR